ncbi:hypothetical protein [Gemmobacter nectariphilus]|uniref:hypothetical protein n=1 Tax=Gemmobacter nectariphilus TaxID=220343 RepID=UPI00040B83CE|nr:hypothetical protein [Gemmobacter nectariphilus]
MADENLERITILLQAKDRDFARAMDRNNKLIARLTRDAEKGTTTMARRVQANFSDMTVSVRNFAIGFAGGIAGGLVTGAISNLTSGLTRTVKSIATIGDEAKRAGMGLEAFQEWSAVADRTRVGMDALVDGFKELSLRADEFIVTGMGSAAESFKRLGYSAADLKVKLQDPSALMLELIDRLQQLDTAARIRVADELFGGTGGEQFVQLIDRGAEGIQKIINEAHATGAVLDEQLIRKAQDIDERFTAMTQKFTAWGKAVAVALADLPFDMVETRLREIFPDEAFGRAVLGDEIFDRLIDLRKLTDDQAESAERLAQMHRQMGEEGRAAASAILMSMNELPSQEFAAIRGELAGIAEEMRQLAAELDTGAIKGDEFQKRMGQAEARASALFAALRDDSGITLSNAISAVGRLGTAIANALGLARSLKATLPGGVAKDVPGYLDSLDQSPSPFVPNPNAPKTRPRAAPNELGFDIVDTGRGGSGEKKASAKDILELAEAEIAILERKIEVMGREDAVTAELEAKYRLLDAAKQRGIDLDQRSAETGKTLREEIDEQAAAIGRLTVEADRYAERARFMDDITGDLRDGLLDAIVAGEDFKGVLAGVAKALAKAALEAALFNTGPFSSGGGGGGLLGGLFGGLLGKRAAGGPVVSGQPYQINENTPNSEIFVPSRSGGVLNVAQARDALRGGAQPVAITVYSDPSVVVRAAEGAAVRVVQRAAPEIMSGAVDATYARAREVPLP